jgi:hypothetical protein
VEIKAFAEALKLPPAESPTALPGCAEAICAARLRFPVRDAIVMVPCSVVKEEPDRETFPLPTRERFPPTCVKMVSPVRLSVPGVEELPVAMRFKLTFGLTEMVAFWISIFGA